MAELVKAVYAFDNPANDNEMPFNVGDIITVTGKPDAGWWEGECNGRKGMFPANYCEPYKAPSAQSVPSAPSRAPSTRNTVGGMASAHIKGSVSTESKEKTRREQKLPTRYGQWASNMAIFTGCHAIAIGLASIFWGGADEDRHSIFPVFTGLYCIAIGVLAPFWEWTYGYKKQAGGIPIRAFVYLGASVFPFFGTPTILIGVMFAIVSIFNFISAYQGEEYEDMRRAKKKKEALFAMNDNLTWCDQIAEWFGIIFKQNKLGLFIFMLAYIVGNLVLLFSVVDEWVEKNNSFGEDDRLSNWGPMAKGFGNLLDLNCSLLLVPVTRTLLNILYNQSTADQGCWSKFLRSLLFIIPLDRALSFHKLVAKFVLFCALGHTFFHFMNYAYRPEQTVAFFGTWPWWTGGVILLCMLFMYSSVPKNVKMGQFEAFWYSHHLFIIFFLAILSHGKEGYNPNFWKWFALPGFLYLAERVARNYRSNKTVKLMSVTNMEAPGGDVIALEFAREGVFSQPYQIGQYLFICALPISYWEWHPFTISSAPEEETVTIHIRVQGPGSWTQRLQAYLLRMGPQNASWFPLLRSEGGQQVQGRVRGPTGEIMFNLDAPHSAPTQHVKEYSTCMVVGAGIGVTPVAATLKSVVFHIWKFGLGQCFPDHAYFVWSCSHKDVDGFRWLVRVMKDAQDEVHHMRQTSNSMTTKTFEVHIYITSVPKNKPKYVFPEDYDDVSFFGIPSKERTVDKQRSQVDEKEIYALMEDPPNEDGGYRIPGSDIWIHNGRPKWKPRFDAVSKAHPTGNIGVTFCGNPMIARALQSECFHASETRSSGLFKLHKENF